MTKTQENYLCPHCRHELQPFELPDSTGWDESCQWACFNNECSYYREGWEWMWNKYEVKASYRYRLINPQTGYAEPLPVWSETAICNRIVKPKKPWSKPKMCTSIFLKKDR